MAVAVAVAGEAVALSKSSPAPNRQRLCLLGAGTAFLCPPRLPSSLILILINKRTSSPNAIIWMKTHELETVIQSLSEEKHMTQTTRGQGQAGAGTEPRVASSETGRARAPGSPPGSLQPPLGPPARPPGATTRGCRQGQPAAPLTSREDAGPKQHTRTCASPGSQGRKAGQAGPASADGDSRRPPGERQRCAPARPDRNTRQAAGGSVRTETRGRSTHPAAGHAPLQSGTEVWVSVIGLMAR